MEENLISTPLIWSEVESAKILVGKILANRSYTRSTIESIVRKAWNLQSGVVVTEITVNAFMFNFTSKEEYSRVLRGRPWSINGCLLNLLERAKFKSYEEFDSSRCPFWIQIHNIPLEALCLANASTIGSHIGEVTLAEDPLYNGRYLRNFLRARVIVDLRKPLAYGFWLPRPDGRKIWIAIKYEKLQSFCYSCGKLGHDNRTCHSTKLMSCFNPREPRFGDWISANVCRSWDETLAVIKSEDTEAIYIQRKQEEAARERIVPEHLRPHNACPAMDDDLFTIRITNSTTGTQSHIVEDQRPKAETHVAETSNPNSPSLSRGGDGGSRTMHEVIRSRDENANTKQRHAPAILCCEELQDKEPLSKQINSDNHLIPKILPEMDVENSMAIVLYDSGGMNEVIKGFDSLGLKRHADEDWEASVLKKRRVIKETSSPLSDISNFANNLKKVKARSKRSGKKRAFPSKDTPLVVEDSHDKVMEDSSGCDFVFRAKGGKKKGETANGSGGWPITAPRSP